jgi:preprotein translocase subunit SecE
MRGGAHSVSRNPIVWAQRSREFVAEVQIEVSKVTWPTRKEAAAGTVAVLVIIGIMMTALFGVDALLAWLMSLVLP